MIRLAYLQGVRAACLKFALAPPSQVDQFVADIEQAKDAPLPGALPPMSGPPPTPTALDGTTPLDTTMTTPAPAPGLQGV